MPAPKPKPITPAELAEIHSLPDDALITAHEAAAFLRLKYATLAWQRCMGVGPPFARVGPKQIRYRLGSLRAYIDGGGQPLGDGTRRAADAALAARIAKGQVHA